MGVSSSLTPFDPPMCNLQHHHPVNLDQESKSVKLRMASWNSETSSRKKKIFLNVNAQFLFKRLNVEKYAF